MLSVSQDIIYFLKRQPEIPYPSLSQLLDQQIWMQYLCCGGINETGLMISSIVNTKPFSKEINHVFFTKQTSQMSPTF